MRQAAADDRIKRASTEITGHRALENERKRLFSEADDLFKEVQDRLDAIERQRQEILDRWSERREARELSERRLSDARANTERALGVVRAETLQRDKELENVHEIEAEKSKYEKRLGEAYRRAVDVYSRELGRRVEQAFAGEEERDRRRQLTEDFKRARHEDQNIGDLCDQRDQFRDLIPRASVPAVADTLRRELEKVERELEKRYPGALSIDEKVPSVVLVEEIYYLTGTDGFLCIVLPITQQVWDGIGNGETGIGPACAMRIVWELIKNLDLKPEDGEFCLKNGCCMFVSNTLRADDMTTISEFILRFRNLATLTFRFVPFPAQIQEALSDESVYC